MPQLTTYDSVKKPTFKQKKFAKKYIENGGNATQAALETYNANYDASQVIASQNLNKPAVINEINRLLSEVGLSDDEWIAKNIKAAIDSGIGQKATNKDAVTVLNMLLKLKNSYPVARSMKMNINVNAQSSPKSTSETIAAVKSLSVKSSELIKDLTG